MVWAWLVALGLVATYAAVHAQAIVALVGMWDRNPMYSYGYLVAPVSLYMVWAKRDALARLEPRPSIVAGTLILAAWLVLMVVGRIGSIILFEQIALLLALTGVVLLVFGARTLAVISVPLAYLLLMIPFWDALTEPLHVPFQNLSANVGVRILQVLGIPAYREGTFVTLSSIRLEVARACSGVNYLVAVIALGLPLGYMYLRSTRRRILLVASAVLVAALSNSLRVALIGILVTVDPETPLHGPGHVLHGLFVAGIGHVTIFVSLWLLLRAEQRAGITPARRPERATATGWSRSAFRRASLKGPVAAMALFAITAAFLHTLVIAPVKLAADLETLPRQLGRWTADPFARPPAPRFWSDSDHELSRRYRADGLTADIFVGYFAAQQHDREIVTPRAESLHRAARPVTLTPRVGRAIAVNRAVSKEGAYQHLTVFWYEVDGQTAAGSTAVKLRTMWNAVAHRRTDATIISVTMQIPRDADPRPAEAALDELASALDHALRAYLPGRRSPEAVALVQREAGRS